MLLSPVANYLVLLAASVVLLAGSWPIRSIRVKSIIKSIAFTVAGIAIYVSLTTGYGLLAGCIAATCLLALSAAIAVYGVESRRVEGLEQGFEGALDLLLLLSPLVLASPSLGIFIALWIIDKVLAFMLVSAPYWSRGVRDSLKAGYKLLVISMATFDISAFTMIYAVLVCNWFSPVVALTSLFLDPLPRTLPCLGALSLPLQFMLILGFLCKMAIVPLHFWLPDAYTLAPSSASAALGGVMASMGVYGLYMVLLYLNPYVHLLVAVLASVSILYGFAMALSQDDAKRMIAFTSISTMGFSSLAAMVAAYSASLLGLVALISVILYNAAYKSTLFLSLGLIEAQEHGRSLTLLRGRVRVARLQGLLAVSSMLSIPGSIGFTSKALVVASIAVSPLPPCYKIPLLCIIASYLASSAVIGLRFSRLYGSPGTITVHKAMEASSISVSALNIVYSLIVAALLEPILALAVIPLTLLPLLVGLSSGRL